MDPHVVPGGDGPLAIGDGCKRGYRDRAQRRDDLAALVDRSNGAVDLGVPFYPLIDINFPTYDEAELPRFAEIGVAAATAVREQFGWRADVGRQTPRR